MNIKDIIIPLIAGVACASLIGCVENDSLKEKSFEEARELGTHEKMEYIKFDGHEYVLYQHGPKNSDWSSMGIAHSPKCPCKFEPETRFH